MTLETAVNLIFAPLIGAAVLWLWSQYVSPLVDSFLSKAPRLSRNWNFSDEKGGPVVGTAVLKQFGSRVKFEATRTTSRDGASCNRAFIYRGRIVGRTMVLEFEQSGAMRTVSGALVLRARSDLQNLEGRTSYYSDSEGEVISNRIFYHSQP